MAIVVAAFYIEAPHFVALVTPSDPRMTAPIIKYMASWSEERIREYCARQRWRVERVTMLSP